MNKLIQGYNQAVNKRLIKKDYNFSKLNQQDRVFKILFNAHKPVPSYVFPKKYGILSYRKMISNLNKVFDMKIENIRTSVYNEETEQYEIHSVYWMDKEVAKSSK